jgi:MFS transporter, OFA family, oxalate/formate antiporter
MSSKAQDGVERETYGGAHAMSATPASGEIPVNRWTQMIIGVVCMVLIANMQYGWTLFVNPMAKANNWDVAGIQVAFSIFIALETWLTPLEGWLADTLGPHRGPGASALRCRF